MVLEQRFGYLTTYKIRYIFILFFAWMNYVSGSFIMVLINQIISVITAVFLVFSCLLLPTVFSSSFLSKLLIQIAETIWRSILLSSLCPFPWLLYEILSLLFWFSDSRRKVWKSGEHKIIGGFCFCFCQNLVGHLSPFPQHTRFRRLYWIVKRKHSGLSNISYIPNICYFFAMNVWSTGISFDIFQKTLAGNNTES